MSSAPTVTQSSGYGSFASPFEGDTYALFTGSFTINGAGLGSVSTSVFDVADYAAGNNSIWVGVNGIRYSSRFTNIRVAYAQLLSNEVTLYLTNSHYFSAGDTIYVHDIGYPYDGEWLVSSTPTTTSLTYARVASNTGFAAIDSGEVTYKIGRAHV